MQIFHIEVIRVLKFTAYSARLTCGQDSVCILGARIYCHLAFDSVHLRQNQNLRRTLYLRNENLV